MKKLCDYKEKELESLDDYQLWDLGLLDLKDKIFERLEIEIFPNIETIFNTLDSYKRFCIKFGRPYNEAHIYNNQSKYWLEYLLIVDKKNKMKVQNYWKRDET